MGLQTQILDYPFTGGPSKKLDAVLVGQPKLLDVLNYSFQKDGTLYPRDGIPLLTTIAHNAVELMPFGSQLLRIGGVLGTDVDLYSYSPQTGWIDAGTPPFISATAQQLQRGTAGGSIGQPDSANASGIAVYVWIQTITTGTAPFYCVIDEATGAYIAQPQLMAAFTTACNVRVAVAGSSFVAGVGTNSGAGLFMYHMPIGGSSWTAGGTFSDWSTTSQQMDMVSMGPSPTQAVIVYGSNSGNSVVMALIDSTAVAVGSSYVGVVSSGTIAAANVGGLSVVGLSATQVLVFAGSSNTAHVYTTPGTWNPVGMSWSGISPSSVNVVINPFLLGACATSGTTAECVVGTSLSSPGSSQIVRFALNTSNTVTSGPARIMFSVTSPNQKFIGPVLAAKPFVQNGLVRYPVGLYSQTQAQGALLVIDVTGHVLAKSLQSTFAIFTSSTTGGNTGCGQINIAWSLCNGIVPSTGASYVIPTAQYGQNNLLSSVSGGSNEINLTPVGLSRVLLTYGRSVAPVSWHAMAGPALFLSGGNPCQYDGANVVEAGFHYGPEDVTASSTASGTMGSGLTSAGAYQVVFVYEWFDNLGNRHQSAPSSPTSFTAATSASDIIYCTVEGPDLVLGARGTGGGFTANQAAIVAYRTVAGGTTFFRDVGMSSSSANAIAGTTYRAGTIPMAAFSTGNTTAYSALTDAVLQSNEPLYTQPDTGDATDLANLCPPDFNVLTQWQSRLFYVPADYPYEVRFSQLPTPGVGLYFSPALTLGFIPTDYGPITALGVLDDNLIVFTAQRTFRVYGTGPDATGNTGAYSNYQLLPRGAGCIDQRSILNLPTGQAHQTKQGLYLLNRDFTDSYFGSDIEPDVLGQTITSAVLCADKAQARWTVPGQNYVIVYDYLMGQWSKFSGTGNASTGMSFDGACLWNGLFTAIDNANACVDQETPGLYFDGSGSTVIAKQLRTAWIKLGAMQGFERLRRVVFFGVYGSNSIIGSSENTDYNTGAIYGPTVALSNALTTTDGLRFQFRKHVVQQKGQAFRFFIADTPDGTGSGFGCGYTGISLELAVKTGTAKLPAAQSF